MHKVQMAQMARMNYIKMQIDGILPVEVYEIYVKPNFATASWRFSNNVHQIVIGENIFHNAKEHMTHNDKAKYLTAYLYHEIAHSIWTEKDLKMVSDELLIETIPFQLFNLFEDARIEEKMRRNSKKAFNWIQYEELNRPVNALGFFFYMIQCEHHRKSLVKMKQSLPKALQEDFNVTFDFYKRALKCENSLKLIPLLREWIDKFPKTIEYIQTIQEYGNFFYEESKYIGNNAKFEELLEDAVEISLLSSSNIVSGDNNKKIRKKARDAKKGSLLHNYGVPNPFDVDKRDLLLKKMEKLFYEPDKLLSTRIPSKRVNLKKFSKGSEKIFRKKSALKVDQKKITIILDLSGSMVSAIENMRLLIDVIDKMARKNLIDATLILTANRYYSTYEILKMPLEAGVISRMIPFDSAEGLDKTMKKNITLLSQSDYNWILTDGYIDEAPLNKIYYTNRGVKTHAMYIGDTSSKEEMKKSFDNVICEKSIEDMAQKVFTLVK